MIQQKRICVEKVSKTDAIELYEMRKLPVNSVKFQKLKAAFLTKKLWDKNKNIKIFFMGHGNNVPRTPLSYIKRSRDNEGNMLQIDNLQLLITPETGKGISTIDAVKKIVFERIQPIVGLKLEFTDNIQESTIRINFDPNQGAWSLLGTDCEDSYFRGKPTMNLGWLDVATTIHEFCHALGMIHEHQNPSGNTIQWNEQAVYNWARQTQGWNEQTTKNNIIDRYQLDSVNGSEYDPKSIMLYFFPASLTLNNKGTQQNLTLSSNDVVYLNKMYPGSCTTPNDFLQNIYGRSLEIQNESNEDIESHANIITILIVILIILGVFVLVYIYKKNKLNKIK